jgi:hypothetical protein
VTSEARVCREFHAGQLILCVAPVRDREECGKGLGRVRSGRIARVCLGSDGQTDPDEERLCPRCRALLTIRFVRAD